MGQRHSLNGATHHCHQAWIWIPSFEGGADRARPAGWVQAPRECFGSLPGSFARLRQLYSIKPQNREDIRTNLPTLLSRF